MLQRITSDIWYWNTRNHLVSVINTTHHFHVNPFSSELRLQPPPPLLYLSFHHHHHHHPPSLSLSPFFSSLVLKYTGCHPFKLDIRLQAQCCPGCHCVVYPFVCFFFHCWCLLLLLLLLTALLRSSAAHIFYVSFTSRGNVAWRVRTVTSLCGHGPNILITRWFPEWCCVPSLRKVSRRRSNRLCTFFCLFFPPPSPHLLLLLPRGYFCRR